MNWVHVAAKELKLELRTRDTLIAMALVGFTSITIGLLAFHDEAAGDPNVASGVLWMGLAFAASLGLARAFGAEKDRGTLDTLLLLPVERGTLYIGKAVANFVLVLFVAGLTVPAYLFLGGGGAAFAGSAWGLLALFTLGALGLAATGTMLSALAAQTRGRDLLLPVLMFPILVPLLLATVHGTHDVLHGAPFSEWRSELLVLAGYDVAFLAASILLFEAAMEG